MVESIRRPFDVETLNTTSNARLAEHACDLQDYICPFEFRCDNKFFDYLEGLHFPIEMYFGLALNNP